MATVETTEWAREARRRGRCAFCGETRGWLQGHHVIPKQRLKRLGLHAHLWDQRNMMVLCSICHARHEVAFRRLPRALLTSDNEEFAAELGVDWMLEKLYA